MKARYIIGLATLLTLLIYLFLSSFAGMDADQASNAEVGSESVDSSTASTKMSSFGLVFFLLCLLWHLIAFVVCKRETGKAFISWKCKNTRSFRTEYCRKVSYSDDEESLMDSTIRDTPKSLNSVRAITERYIQWLCRPALLLCEKLSAKCAQRIGPRGLRNIGNTCYFNSVMQVLANTYILQTSIHETIDSGEFSRHFEEFCKWVSNRTMGSSSTCNLWNHLGSMLEQIRAPPEMHRLFASRAQRFSDFGQHDSHECLRHILDELRKDERDFRKKSWSIAYNERKSLTVVDKIFGGHFITVYNCKECAVPYYLFEPFLDISLPVCLGSTINDNMEVEYTIGRNPDLSLINCIRKVMTRVADPASYDRHFPKSQYSINDCLWYFTRTDHIQDEYLCHNCNSIHIKNGDTDVRLTSATKETLIFNPPAVMTIHLKRFELQPGKSVKRSDRIKYGELLDIAPYCSEYGLRNENSQQNIWYSLYGIIVHAGYLEFGHYIAYIKVREEVPDLQEFLQQEYFDCEKSKMQLIEMIEKISRLKVRRSTPSSDAKANEGIWYRMNDNWVSEVSVDEVLNQEAYLLLYERI